MNDALGYWESKHQGAFKAIKEELTKTPVLAYFDLKADYVNQVNRSMKALGTVLLQKSRPVLYMSNILALAEAGYSALRGSYSA